MITVGIIAVCMKIGAVNTSRGRPIVSFHSEWDRRGKPVTVEEVRAKDIPVYTKFTVTCASGRAADGFVTADIKEKLAEGQEIRFADGGTPCGRVVSVGRELDVITGMFPVGVEFNDPPASAESPLVVYARTRTLPGALVVPNEVLDVSGGGYSVWKICDGRAMKAGVRLESRNGYGAVLSGGMRSGDSLVLTGRSVLEERDTVNRTGTSATPQADRGAGAQ